MPFPSARPRFGSWVKVQADPFRNVDKWVGRFSRLSLPRFPIVENSIPRGVLARAGRSNPVRDYRMELSKFALVSGSNSRQLLIANLSHRWTHTHTYTNLRGRPCQQLLISSEAYPELFLSDEISCQNSEVVSSPS